MATLFNTKISATYEGLLKTIDNAAISATLRELTDGSGNQSGLYLNTAGDFKVTNVLEWGSLKDTGTGVTITRFVTSTDGLENFDNNTSLPTSAAVKLYVDTKFATSDTLQEVLVFGNTTSGNDIAVSAGDDITFTDSSKIILGTSSEFEIFQDTIDSRITTSSNLYIQTPQFRLQKVGGEQMISAISDAQVELYYNNSKRLETTIDGSKVTGNLVVTGTITGAGGSFLQLSGGTMTGNTIHNDNVKSIYGTASDGLEIYHDSLNSVIRDSGTGNLVIAADDFRVQISEQTANMITANTGAEVNLMYNGGTKIATTNTGVSVTGALSTTTNISVGANATFVDNGKAIFGAGSDLEIYHDGSNSFISDLGAGNLEIKSDFINVTSAAGETMATFNDNNAVSLYFNNVKRLETVTAGAKVTGNLEVTGTITGAGGSFLPLIGGTMTGDIVLNDNIKTSYGASADFEIYHNASTNSNFIQSNSSRQLILAQDNIFIGNQAASESMITAVAEGAVQLYYDNANKLETTDTGILVLGNGEFFGNVSIPDSGQLQLGSGNDAQLSHNGTNFKLKSNSGDLYIDQAATTQSIIFRTSNANALDTTALIINRGGDLITGRDVTIAGDLTVNGTTTTVNSQTLSVDDPLISLAINNDANSLDIGYYGKYNDATTRYLGLFNDASDSNKFKLFKGTTVEPTTTVNIGAAGYVAADLQVAQFESTNVIISSSSGSGSQLSIQAASPYIEFIDNQATNRRAQIKADNGNLIFNLDINQSEPNTSMQFNMDGSNAMTIDTSKNTTFAGNVNANGTGISSFGGQVNVGTKLLMNNNQELRWLDSGNTQRTVLEVDSNDDLYLGKSGGGNLYLVNGTSYTTAVTIDASQNATFAGDVNLTAGQLEMRGDVALDHDGSSLYVKAPSSIFLFPANTNKGNINAAGLLTIAGGGNFGGNVTTNGDITIDNASGDPFLKFKTTAQEYVIRIDQSDDEKFQIRDITNNATRLTIDASGNVGIGTASPDAKLEVAGDVLISSGEYLSWGTAGATSIEGSTASNKLQFRTNSTDRMIINDTGVGIGTTSPKSTLNISQGVTSGAVPTTLTIENTDANILSGNDINRIDFFANDGSTSGVAVQGRISSVAENNGNQAGLSFSTYNTTNLLTERMRIDHLGNVGIGTNSPDHKLRVDGDARLGNLHIKTSDFGVGGTGKTIYADGAGSGLLGFISTTAFDFSNGATSRMHIDSAGKIAIGNNIPMWSGSYGGALFLKGNNATSDRYAQLTNVDSSGNSTGVGLVVKAGNVGIGTDSPSTGLEIENGGLGLPATTGINNAISFMRLKKSTSGWGVDYGLNTIGVPAGWIQARDTSNFATNAAFLINPNGGNVGIGKNNPVATLDVAGSVWGESFKLFTSGSQFFNVVSYSGNPYITGAGGSGDTVYFGLPVSNVTNIQVQGVATATNFIVSSDRTLKDNIKEIEINNINVNWKNFELISEPGVKRAGVIAQELEETNPEFVRTDEDGLKSVAYIDLLITKIAELEARLQKLELK